MFPPVARLSDRKAIWQDAWNNEVYGDQVANGLWGIAAGGIPDRVERFCKTIPESTYRYDSPCNWGRV
ncbi:hypothetical protein CS542_02185 [Pedobacter sp. IW39]|nr:hypothetical protein CS542_02185 [Pedobacter sp. IW39]